MKSSSRDTPRRSLDELLDLLGSALMDMHSLHISTKATEIAEAEYDAIRAEIKNVATPAAIVGAPVDGDSGVTAGETAPTLLSPTATVGEEEIKRFRVGDILFSDEQAKMFCDLAMKGLRAEGAIKTLPDAARLVQRFETALQIAVTADLTPGGVSKARAKAVWDNADEKRSDLLKALTPSAIPSALITGELIKGAPVPDPGTEKMLRTMLDRAYKMMLQAGYRVAEVNSDHNDPIIAWMSDARAVLYGSGRQPDLGSLT